MSFYQQQFNNKVLGLLPVRDWNIIFRRLANWQWDRTGAALKGLSLPSFGVLDFRVEDLSFHWSINLDVGYHTLAIFNAKAPAVPVIVVERKLPCIGHPSQEDTLKGIRYHWSGYSEDTINNNALAETVNHIKDIAVEVLQRDLAEMETANGYHKAHNVKMKEYL